MEVLKHNILYDVIIIGSGPAGVHSAYPLVEAGLKVAMIDGGLSSQKQNLNPAQKDTKSKSNPHDLLMKSGYVYSKTYQHLKLNNNIDIIQSLAKGGLSQIWHGICDYFTTAELNEIGLPAKDIEKEYQVIADRINLKSKPELDLHGELILETAKTKVYRLATVNPYRTSRTVEELKKHQNFTYFPNQVVFQTKEQSQVVEITSFSINKLTPHLFKARFIVLAAGSINTTRILLNSFQAYNQKTPFLTKGHTIFVCLNFKRIFSFKKINNLNPGQLALTCRNQIKKLDAFFLQFYRCNPLASELALNYIPLPKPLATALFSLINPFLVIADIRFPTFESKNRFCILKQDGSPTGILEIHSSPTATELNSNHSQLNRIYRQLWSLGLIPLKKIVSDVTSHYAGGIPYKSKPSKLSADINGKLHQAQRIYIADSSTWKALPAKPPTLTIMANASRVGKNVLKKLQHA